MSFASRCDGPSVGAIAPPERGAKTDCNCLYHCVESRAHSSDSWDGRQSTPFRFSHVPFIVWINESMAAIAISFRFKTVHLNHHLTPLPFHFFSFTSFHFPFFILPFSFLDIHGEARSNHLQNVHVHHLYCANTMYYRSSKHLLKVDELIEQRKL